ncbi:MAG: chromosomal replication initiator protein DnaA [Bacteroidaceae bacterium]
MQMFDHIELWNRCLDFIRDNVPPTAYNTWFASIVPMKYENDALTIQMPSQFAYEFLEEHYADLVIKGIRKLTGKNTQLMYMIAGTEVNMPAAPASAPAAPAVKDERKSPAPWQELDSHLNTKYTFDNFVEGGSNRLSRSVGEAVAQNPASAFNPLFIYGPSGVGKTHLISAIGLKIKELHPTMRVLYISAHLFQVQYTNAVRDNKVNDFIMFYQTIDVLIIDDVQEFGGLTKTQNTFFHIFNHLHQNGKQLIMSSDRPPVALQGMEERLLTRFKWGLIAEMERPNVELRRDILLDKMHKDGLRFPVEVVDYIAENVDNSVRDLEGTVLSLMARSIYMNRDIDVDLARLIIKQVADRNETEQPITMEQIVERTCAYYGLDKALIQTKTRKREVVRARQVAMYMAKKFTDNSSSKIGFVIGRKDHATVIHACKIVEDQRTVDKAFSSELHEVEELIRKRN